MVNRLADVSRRPGSIGESLTFDGVTSAVVITLVLRPDHICALSHRVLRHFASVLVAKPTPVGAGREARGIRGEFGFQGGERRGAFLDQGLAGTASGRGFPSR